MTPQEILTVATGTMFCGAGACIGLWQILSSPDAPNYPTSGQMKRTFMFWTMVFLLVVGVGVSQGPWLETPRYSTGQGAGLAFFLLALFGTFLVDHLRNWLPARTHARIRQLLALASCKPPAGLEEARESANSTGEFIPPVSVVGPALLDLATSGVRVIGPNEGPSAVTDYRL